MDNDDHEEEDVDKHDNEDWQMEQKEKFSALMTNKTDILPNLWIKIRVFINYILKNYKNSCEENSRAPANERIKDEPGLMGRRRRRRKAMKQGIAEIEAHDCHPGKHGYGREVAKEANNHAVDALEVNVVNCS